MPDPDDLVLRECGAATLVSSKFANGGLYMVRCNRPQHFGEEDDEHRFEFGNHCIRWARTSAVTQQKT